MKEMTWLVFSIVFTWGLSVRALANLIQADLSGNECTNVYLKPLLLCLKLRIGNRLISLTDGQTDFCAYVGVKHHGFAWRCGFSSGLEAALYSLGLEAQVMNFYIRKVYQQPKITIHLTTMLLHFLCGTCFFGSWYKSLFCHLLLPQHKSLSKSVFSHDSEAIRTDP